MTGKHTGAGRAFSKAHDQDVIALMFIITRPANRDLNAFDWQYVRKRHSQGRDQQARLARPITGSHRTQEPRCTIQKPL
jgi:hypothetical protein